MIKTLSILFTAGAVGGIANGLFVWLMGKSGLNAAMGVQIAPDWSPAYIYPRIVWGGIWGLIFLVPVFQTTPWLKGALLGLAPTVVVLTVVLPFQLNKGMFGLQLGAMVPVFAILANTVWGIAAAYWIQWSESIQ